MLHLPGHSPGSIALHEKATRTLFSGDAVYDGELIDNAWHSDPEAYRESLARRRELPVTTVHAGHFGSFGRERLLELIDLRARRRDAHGERGGLARGARRACMRPAHAMAVRHGFGELSTDMAAVGRAAPPILTLGLCMFSIPNVVVLWAAQRVEPARVDILLRAEVLTGTVSAALFSDEPFGAAQAVGATLIVAAGAAAVSARRQGSAGAASKAWRSIWKGDRPWSRTNAKWPSRG